MPPPRLSVVIPTRERWEVLRRTLEALDGQAAADPFEVVVVDNGSADGSREQLERFASERSAGPELLVLDEPAPGAGAARNAGVRAARGALVLFLGDDSIPAAEALVAGHLRAHGASADPHRAVLGRAAWDPSLAVTPVMEWLMRSGKQFDFERLEREPAGAGAFYTINLSLSREAVLAAGGFDERFAAAAWEDVDLGLRLFDRGLRIDYVPELLVHHAHRLELADSVTRMVAVGGGGALLNAAHAQRRPLPARVPSGRAARVARTLAPVLVRLPVPDGLPRPVRDVVFSAVHLGAYVRAYRSAPAPPPPRLGLAGGLQPAAGSRPPVSVVVPFSGDREEAAACVARLERLVLRPGDEVIVADNARTPVVEGIAGGSVTAVRAGGEPASYHARNAGAARGSGEWLLFLDADCRPPPDLLDRFFAEAIDPACGAIAGGLGTAEEQRSLIPDYQRSRSQVRQEAHLLHPYRPFGATGNLLVRRRAFEAIGGFHEGISSGGDADLCWRLQAAGWTLGYREAARVEHPDQEGLRPLVRQIVRHAAGHAWLNRRYPGSCPRPSAAAGLLRCGAGIAVWTVLGHRRRALYKGIDAVVITAEKVGRLRSNRPPGARRGAPVARPAGTPVLVRADLFPELSETFVVREIEALAHLGHPVRVEAAGRARRPAPESLTGMRIDLLEDDSTTAKLLALCWLVARHPRAAAADLAARRRWRREEPVRPLRSLAPSARRLARSGEQHVHAHFAAGAALDSMRLSRILGVPYSVTAHAYDIFLRPANLREKLERAAFATTGCRYNADHLRTLVSPEAGAQIHVVVMGVDGERFQRRSAPPAGRHVVAVGRLVEKKGFDDLLEAVALLGERAPLDKLTLVGDGPLGPSLRVHADALGLGDTVEFAGPRDPDEVRELLEGADLLAAPCVIAADGDRDSMPVVVKEALSMEVPVVATDEVGLPEIVRPEWGRLVSPRDPRAIAAAIDELLSLPAEQRARMGAEGRRFVLEHAGVERETAKLSRLIG